MNASARDTRRLKKGLAVEIESRRNGVDGSYKSGTGEAEPSVILMLTPGSPPRVALSDASGVVAEKVVSYVDLLGTIEDSALIRQLDTDATRVTPLPELPPGTILADVIERPSGNRFVFTGALEPRKHLFTLTRGEEITTYDLKLPHVIWRILWDQQTRQIRAFSLALASPEHKGPVTPETELYRWVWSNVYDTFRYYHYEGDGVLEGVCWYTVSQLTLEPREIVEKAVLGFIATPNDALNYSRDLAGRTPCATYEETLQAIESAGGVPEDWLQPCSMNVQNLHDQVRRTK